MAALMRSTGKEIEENCRPVRDVTASHKTKREETIIRFKELFEQWKRSEPIKQIQMECDERLWGTGPTSVKFQGQLHYQEWLK